ncbi:type II toxin-antitoxin system HigA family antitoxin [Sinorhizobium meliloti WSM1022]|jgi:HTH-type transcriptional regulator/antitoxin HigA|uniref:HTH cro/C1-type domain-containing protein n=5 Tax=Sinorhizobium TaxID=28105 RepID=Q92KM2_RHIME|nr:MULTISPECIES: type II toxin-antitoxin system HigA family antitoxin [Sinorhizobium]PST29164.1 type II toxin-antitoxin system HigA family antitoxin [Mesorhizobium loti]TWA94196.1 HTH-type transcriptional regulator/antitoxin HigA [Ensifer sp. SEMIA 134]TWB28227.1 HTH-type transcriptional regulator/antitoxin HigA [Ensifer sp. SEMIA 135]AEG03325.1 transcriptional regulator, XRE family [Sinorhizobium meliloti BL225C]AEG52240.1 transcriptional regulator, XRE family [Sinorhizobium meliloti AK83]
MDNIRAIRNDDDLAWAIHEVSKYFDQPPETGTEEADRFDILSTLIEAYENEHHPIEAPEPVELIKAHMEMFGRTQADLAALFGSRSRASEILSKRRALTVDMIRRLHKEWGIPTDCLVEPYHLVEPERAYA